MTTVGFVIESEEVCINFLGGHFTWPSIRQSRFELKMIDGDRFYQKRACGFLSCSISARLRITSALATQEPDPQWDEVLLFV